MKAKTKDVEILKEMMNIAKRIKSIRVWQGYTQTKFAKKLGVHQQYISKIENCTGNTTVKTLKKVANALGVKLIIKLK